MIKGYSKAKYREWLKEAGIKDENNLPDGVKIVGKRGNWFFEDSRTVRDQDGIPKIKPLGVTGRNVYIICPNCKRIHKHGVRPDGYTGHKSAHCITDIKGGYFIV